MSVHVMFYSHFSCIPIHLYMYTCSINCYMHILSCAKSLDIQYIINVISLSFQTNNILCTCCSECCLVYVSEWFPYCKHVTHTETAISFTKDTKTAMLYKAATEWREMLYPPYNLCPFILDTHGRACTIIILLIMLHMCPAYFRIVLGFCLFISVSFTLSSTSISVSYQCIGWHMCIILILMPECI